MNRVDFLIRTVQYYASINSPHPIYIGDASDLSSEDMVIKSADNKIKVHYFHWKGMGDRKTMVELAKKASMKYKYCAFSGDDDYLISSSLFKCSQFLAENISYATAQGNGILFTLDKQGPYGNIASIEAYGNKNCIKKDTVIDRLEEIVSNYWVTNFSVHRINNYIEDMSNGLDDIADRNFGEYANVLSAAIRGKSKYIDCFYLVRNCHDGIDHESTCDWLTSSEWQPSYNAIINLLKSNISQSDKNLSKEDVATISRKVVGQLLYYNNFIISTPGNIPLFKKVLKAMFSLKLFKIFVIKQKISAKLSQNADDIFQFECIRKSLSRKGLNKEGL